MKALLDTNTCIYIIRKKHRSAVERFRAFAANELAVSSITLAELAFGASKSQRPVENRQAIEEFLAPLDIVPFGEEAAMVYGDLHARLAIAGTPIGPNDMLIAAHSLQLGVPLVTNNLKEFSRVPGLVVENWVDFD